MWPHFLYWVDKATLALLNLYSCQPSNLFLPIQLCGKCCDIIISPRSSSEVVSASTPKLLSTFSYVMMPSHHRNHLLQHYRPTLQPLPSNHLCGDVITSLCPSLQRDCRPTLQTSSPHSAVWWHHHISVLSASRQFTFCSAPSPILSVISPAYWPDRKKSVKGICSHLNWINRKKIKVFTSFF